ncbi:hypothetical protein A6F55_19185 [Prescottella equi]|uniref:hypothetical protein n=1 Tax=Rhodococcus hoagii TaxID=43767 RepID=UPI000A119809|nr:hypothetical protein [Prescottella equi]ORL01818.1 hypothetical protein A6F55_19185 [Prescottella equi]
MTDPIADGEPMRYGRDFTLVDGRDADSTRVRLIQLTIRRLTQPTDLITVGRGPDQFPSVRELRGPLQMVRFLVWRDALGTGEAYDEAAALDAIEWLTADERKTVLGQCAFIRQHTAPITPWRLPANPLMHAEAGGKLPSRLDPDAGTPRPEMPRQRALPRPAKTPPMWADQPNKQRRTKYRPTRRVK